MGQRAAKKTIDADLTSKTTAEGLILDMKLLKLPAGKIASPADLLLNTKCGLVDNRQQGA